MYLEIYQQWALHYGFLDAKPIYSANEPGKSISVLVTVGEMGVVWLCGGSVKESLKHVRFKFARDVSINTTDAESVKSFVPDHMVAWEKHSDAGNECISLKELPVGTHLITITSSEHKSALSHVILWP